MQSGAQVLELAESFLREEVSPRAQEIDRDPEALSWALRGLCERDLMALKRPAQYGGPAVDEEIFRRFQESCARYSGALAFLQTQHQSAVSMISRSADGELKDEYLPKMGNGERFKGPPDFIFGAMTHRCSKTNACWCNRSFGRLKARKIQANGMRRISENASAWFGLGVLTGKESWWRLRRLAGRNFSRPSVKRSQRRPAAFRALTRPHACFWQSRRASDNRWGPTSRTCSRGAAWPMSSR
jgi:hypothetical protein